MRSKTNFKQMYLVDATAYNKINHTTTTSTSTPIILGKSNTQISPAALNVSVSAPVTKEREILSPSTFPSTKPTTSVGVQSDVLHTKSTENMIDSPPTKEHESSHTLNNTHQQGVHMNRNEEVSDHNMQINYPPTRRQNRGARNIIRASRNTPYPFQNIYHPSSMNYHTKRLDHSNLNQETSTNPLEKNIAPITKTALQYIVPDTDFQREMTNLPIQNADPPLLPQLMDYTTSYYTPPQTLPQPTMHSQMMNYATNLPIQYINPNTHLTNYTIDSVNQDSTVVSSPQPHQHSTFPPLPEPESQSMEYNDSKPIEYSSPKALPPPSKEDDENCEQCSVVNYKKYDVSLPFDTGLPDNVLFTCTLCENGTNFSTKEKLERHMKNIHNAFTQVEKGIKRKSKQGKSSFKKFKTSRDIVPYLMYDLKKLT